MEILLEATCVCLFVILTIVIIKYILLKRNIRHFSQELEKLKDSNYRQPVKVTDFDKDIVDLAIKVNEHTDIQRKLGADYEQSKKQLGTVILGISHDFRTPLTASLGYLQMIKKCGELTKKNEEYLSIAIDKNKYLKELSDEFFDLTKIENNDEEMHLKRINLSNLLTEAILEQHSWIAERNIRTYFDIQDGVLAQTDSKFLTRIINNLMSNAEKYAADSFSVMLKSKEEHTVLTVSNTLADSNIDVEKVFQPFYRMTSRTAEGSGLGLYVVKLLCDKLGWTAEAEIEGNVFSVRISM